MDIRVASSIAELATELLGEGNEYPEEVFQELTETIWVLRESLHYLKPQNQKLQGDTAALSIKFPKEEEKDHVGPMRYSDIGRYNTWITLECTTDQGECVSHTRAASDALAKALK